MQGRSLRLLRPFPSPFSSPSSFLFEPSSRSLALLLSDSSALLYSPFSSSSSSSSPPPLPTPIPTPSSASCFLRLGPPSRLLFISAFPRGPRLALRAWSLRDEAFVPQTLCLGSKPAASEIVLDLCRGFKLRMCGAVNSLVVYSTGRLCVLGVRVVESGIEVMKCAVIECPMPVYSVTVAAGLIVLGEAGGARVFPLRPLLKRKTEEVRRKQEAGKVRSSIRREAQKKRLPNGVDLGSVAVSAVDQATSGGRQVVPKEPALHKHRTLKLKQNSGDHGSFFVEFKHSKSRQAEDKIGSAASLMAISIHLLSKMKFLVIDSFGGLHILSAQNSVDATIKHIDCSLKVQMLAVLPDPSSGKRHFLVTGLTEIIVDSDRTAHGPPFFENEIRLPESQIAWISDGSHSVHVVSITASGISDDENMDEGKETPPQISVSDAIFTAEKIQGIAPLAANAVLTLCQGNIYAYTTA